jgi:hypothetical protein
MCTGRVSSSAGLANIVIKIGIPVLAVVLSKTYIPFA